MVSGEERAALTAAEQLTDSFIDIVGATTRSVILHGSLSSGGFLPGRSDIDVLAVIDGGLTDAQAAVLERLVRQADTGGAVGIDVHVVTSDIAGAPSRAPSLELHIGRYDGSSIELEVERRVTASPDLSAELSMARADGRALRGAAPREVISPAPADWIVDRGRHWFADLAIADRRCRGRRLHGSHRLPHLAIRPGGRALLKGTSRALGTRPRPLTDGCPAGDPTVRTTVGNQDRRTRHSRRTRHCAARNLTGAMTR